MTKNEFLLSVAMYAVKDGIHGNMDFDEIIGQGDFAEEVEKHYEVVYPDSSSAATAWESWDKAIKQVRNDLHRLLSLLREDEKEYDPIEADAQLLIAMGR